MTRLSSRRIFLEFYVASVAEYGPEAIIKIMIPSEQYFENRIGDFTCYSKTHKLFSYQAWDPAWVYGPGSIFGNRRPRYALWHRSCALMPSRKTLPPPSFGLQLTRPSIRNRPAAFEVCCNLSEIECKIAEDDDIGSRSRRALLAPPRPVEPITWDRLLLDAMQQTQCNRHKNETDSMQKSNATDIIQQTQCNRHNVTGAMQSAYCNQFYSTLGSDWHSVALNLIMHCFALNRTFLRSIALVGGPSWCTC